MFPYYSSQSQASKYGRPITNIKKWMNSAQRQQKWSFKLTYIEKGHCGSIQTCTLTYHHISFFVSRLKAANITRLSDLMKCWVTTSRVKVAALLHGLCRTVKLYHYNGEQTVVQVLKGCVAVTFIFVSLRHKQMTSINDTWPPICNVVTISLLGGKGGGGCNVKYKVWRASIKDNWFSFPILVQLSEFFFPDIVHL